VRRLPKGRARLTQPPRRPDPDPLRKVRFREAARAIVAKDRYDRKYGRAVDTAGAVARAMERAYRQGFEDAQSERPAALREPAEAEEALDWVLIPPRPRNAFWTLCRFTLGREGEPERPGHLVPTITERGTPGWKLISPDGGLETTIAERTILPLIGLGLVELAADAPERLLISDLGRATWRLFLKRGGEYPEDLTQV